MRWLPCLVCLYPAYWLGSSSVYALPAVLAGLVRRTPVDLFASWMGLSARTLGMRSHYEVAVLSTLALILAFLVLLARRHAAVAGWLAVAVGGAGIWRLVLPFRGPGVWVFLLFLVPFCLGVRWLLKDARPGWRATATLASLALVLGVSGNALERRRVEQRKASERNMLLGAPPLPGGPIARTVRFQKGVNFTAEAPGGYFSENVEPMLRQMKSFGVDAVALVPYGGNRRGSPRIGMSGGMEGDESIERVSRIAHALGMFVLLKPQLWVFPGFPGDQEMANESDRRLWFAEYTRFIEHQAELATRVHADMFSVGVEFVKLTRYDADWRKVIARVRQVYPGPLVYAATQGEEFESVKFWDALDYIGLNDYYPLPDSLAMDQVLRKINEVHERYRKPVLFTEVGFTAMKDPHREPWGESRRGLSMQDQARCYEAVLKAVYDKPWLAGMYWWKVGTDGHGGPDDGSFTPWRKPAMEVLSRFYLRSR